MGTIDRYMVYETDEGDTVNSAPEPEGDGVYITVKMYPCSGGTDTGSPEL